MLDILQLFTFPGRSQKLRVFLYSFYTRPRKGTIVVSVCSSKPLLFFQWSQVSCHFLHCLDSGKTEIKPSAASWKACTLYMYFSLFFPYPLRNRELEAFSQLHCAEPGGRTIVSGCHKFYHWFWCGWFHASLGFRSLSTILWISHKEVGPYIVVEQIFPWG